MSISEDRLTRIGLYYFPKRAALGCDKPGLARKGASITLKGKKSATKPKKTSGQAGSGKLTTENGSCSHDGAASSCDKIGACYTCEQFVAHPTALPPEILEKWSGGKPAKRPKTTIDAGRFIPPTISRPFALPSKRHSLRARSQHMRRFRFG